MKIAILTLPIHVNYGGILQAYALQTVLERMGNSVIILNTAPVFRKIQWSRIPKRIVKKILGRDVRIFEEFDQKKEYPIVNKSIIDFRKKYLNEFFIDDFSEIEKLNVDAIVVGSDQVWRPLFFKQMWHAKIEDAFLYFTRDMKIKRLAYAASFGVDTWEMTEYETELIKQIVKKFSCVTVREQSGIALMRDHLGVEAKLVLDPTMLLNAEDYVLQFDLKSVKQSDGDLLVYILDKSKNKDKILSTVIKETGLKPFFVNNELISKRAPIEDRIAPSIELWLRGFYDAKMVITDSFHACVFSILFNKPFFVLGNAGRGLSRIKSLLKVFGLENRYVDLNEKLKCDKNPDTINTTLDILRRFSISVLKENLSSKI